MIHFFHKESAQNVWPFQVGAIADGLIVPMDQIPDPVFSEGVLGFCCGIDSEDGIIYAPADATVVEVSDTFHAIGLSCSNGVEILLHLGIDTVKLGGAGFKCLVKQDAHVRKGQKLMKMDLELIREAGLASTAILCITNSDDYKEVKLCAENKICHSEPILLIEKEI